MKEQAELTERFSTATFDASVITLPAEPERTDMFSTLPVWSATVVLSVMLNCEISFARIIAEADTTTFSTGSFMYTVPEIRSSPFKYTEP